MWKQHIFRKIIFHIQTKNFQKIPAAYMFQVFEFIFSIRITLIFSSCSNQQIFIGKVGNNHSYFICSEFEKFYTTEFTFGYWYTNGLVDRVPCFWWAIWTLFRSLKGIVQGIWTWIRFLGYIIGWWGLIWTSFLEWNLLKFI